MQEERRDLIPAHVNENRSENLLLQVISNNTSLNRASNKIGIASSGTFQDPKPGQGWEVTLDATD